MWQPLDRYYSHKSAPEPGLSHRHGMLIKLSPPDPARMQNQPIRAAPMAPPGCRCECRAAALPSHRPRPACLPPCNGAEAAVIRTSLRFCRRCSLPPALHLKAACHSRGCRGDGDSEQAGSRWAQVCTRTVILSVSEQKAFVRIRAQVETNQHGWVWRVCLASPFFAFIIIPHHHPGVSQKKRIPTSAKTFKLEF